MDSPEKTTRWLWFLVFLLGWPLVVEFLTFVSYLFIFLDTGSVFVAALGGAALTALAWFAARFAFARGAGRGIWIAVAIGSFPYVLAGAIRLVGTGIYPDVPWYFAVDYPEIFALAIGTIGPPLAVFIESRRDRSALVAVGLGEPVAPEPSASLGQGPGA